MHTKFFMLVTGNIMGVSDYSFKTHHTLFVIGEENDPEPENELAVQQT